MRRIGIFSLAVAAIAVGVLWVTGSDETPAAGTTTDAPAAAPNTETVSRKTLQNAEEFKGSLGYGEQFALPGFAAGTVSWVPEDGTVLRPGDMLYKVDEKPTYWTYGDVPMYRELTSGSKGSDVEQLQRYLQEQEYLAADIEIDGKYGRATREAVKDWQDAHGLDDTGRIDGTQLLFLPYDSVRVAAAPRIGDPAAGGVLEVTESTLYVTLDISTRKKTAFEGSPSIEVETADGTRLAASVDSIEAQQSQDAFGGQNYRVRLDLGAAADREPGQVSVDVIDVLASDVLAVPARALVALVEGGYAVEKLNSDGTTTYVGVTLGEFADGWVEVAGDLNEGDRVVVPE
ncbi:MAG: peptidoglycan-binding domain-containing protein [Acidimicrobiia bacterium]|nr:peptidoglycan-binding domain-containing protein [Acidimicrobiia bacterium]